MGTRGLEIIREKKGRRYALRLAGRLDTSTAPQLQRIVEEELSDITSLELDLEKTDYISSAGLRVLLLAAKKMNRTGDMTVKNVKREVQEVFTITGFDKILKIE